MAKPKAVTVWLTEDQADQIQPTFDVADADFAEQRPGLVLAHVLGGVMKVFYLDHERGLEFQRLLGVEVGRVGARPVPAEG